MSLFSKSSSSSSSPLRDNLQNHRIRAQSASDGRHKKFRRLKNLKNVQEKELFQKQQQRWSSISTPATSLTPSPLKPITLPDTCQHQTTTLSWPEADSSHHISLTGDSIDPNNRGNLAEVDHLVNPPRSPNIVLVIK